MNIFSRTLLTLAAYALTASVASANPIVEKGNTIVFSVDVFAQKDAVKTVEWSENFSKKSAQYVQVTAAIKSDTPSLVMLFIVEPLVATFKSAHCDANICTVSVDERFQYGQNKEKTMRFLVFHDKSSKPFQHRFINTSTLSTFANGAEMLSKKATQVGSLIPTVGLVASTGDQAVSTLKSLVGDPLRDF